MVDDGTMPDRRGSLNVDDEGNPTQRNVLIEDGILRGYIQDTLNARLMGVPLTGNGRRESLRAHADAAHDQHLHARPATRTRRRSSRRVKNGLYAANFGGGQVDITSGKFVFSASRGLHDRERQDHVPGQGRDADRQRPRRADPRRR